MWTLNKTQKDIRETPRLVDETTCFTPAFFAISTILTACRRSRSKSSRVGNRLRKTLLQPERLALSAFSLSQSPWVSLTPAAAKAIDFGASRFRAVEWTVQPRLRRRLAIAPPWLPVTPDTKTDGGSGAIIKDVCGLPAGFSGEALMRRRRCARDLKV